jgi:hypothetical protein
VNANVMSQARHLVIGPVLTREGGFALDRWTPGDGLKSGYVYCRVEDAHYARNYGIGVHRNPPSAVACSTVAEFERSIR